MRIWRRALKGASQLRFQEKLRGRRSMRIRGKQRHPTEEIKCQVKLKEWQAKCWVVLKV